MKGQFKASSKTMVAQSYGITVETLNKWLQPIKDDIGEYRCRCYTPKQLEIIVSHLGTPEYTELIYAS